MSTMRALVKAKPEPGLEMADVPVPEVGPNDVRIRIRTSAICGTDMHIWKWDEWAAKTIPVPMHVGHEYVGVIDAVGSAVTGYAVGDRVSGEGHIVCGHCRNCRAGSRHLCPNTVGVGVNRPGSFAEYLVIPAANVFKVPDEISDEVAAIFDPFGNAVHTALSFDAVGEDVLITGAGPIGCMAVAICRFIGARHIVITDVNPWRLDLAKKMGATRAVDTRDQPLTVVMKDLGMTEGFDVGLEMSGSASAFRDMLRSMSNGARIAMLGIMPGEVAIDWSQIVFKGLEVRGIYGRQMYETWYKMAAMVKAGLDVRPVITHRFAINDYRQGFEAMAAGTTGKVLLDW